MGYTAKPSGNYDASRERLVAELLFTLDQQVELALVGRHHDGTGPEDKNLVPEKINDVIRPRALLTVRALGALGAAGLLTSAHQESLSLVVELLRANLLGTSEHGPAGWDFPNDGGLAEFRAEVCEDVAIIESFIAGA